MIGRRRSKTKLPGDLNTLRAANITESTSRPASTSMQDVLGEKLRAYYNEVVNEPVPDRFEQLLKELEARSTSKPSE